MYNYVNKWLNYKWLISKANKNKTHVPGIEPTSTATNDNESR